MFLKLSKMVHENGKSLKQESGLRGKLILLDFSLRPQWNNGLDIFILNIAQIFAI